MLGEHNEAHKLMITLSFLSPLGCRNYFNYLFKVHMNWRSNERAALLDFVFSYAKQ